MAQLANLSDGQLTAGVGTLGALFVVVLALVFRNQIRHVLASGGGEVEVVGPGGVKLKIKRGDEAAKDLRRAALRRGGTALWFPWRTRRQVRLVEDAVDRLGRQPWILWVDDHPSNNSYERRAFERIGVGVKEVTSTTEAMRELSSGTTTYDVVLTDLGRGRKAVAGYELLARLRSHRYSQPVIVYSAAMRKLRRYDEAIGNGARFATASPEKLFWHVSLALESAVRADEAPPSNLGDTPAPDPETP